MSWPFQGFEWVILLVIVLLIFGPKKLPELARGIGQALYEFKKASQGLVEGEKGKEEKKESSEEKVSSKQVSEMDMETLKKLAEKLGVETEGKSRDELIKQIIEKAKEKGLLEESEAKAKKAAKPASKP